MKKLLPAALAIAAVTLAACDRPASTSSTTVVQPTKEKETVVQRDVAVPTPAPSTSSTTIVNPPANVTVDASKPETTTERTKSTTTVDTPMGTATKTETTKTVTK